MSGGCTIPIAEQLADLARLEPGWLDGDGERISSPTLVAVGSEVSRRVPAGVVPYLYPTPNGGVSVEWDAADGAQGFKVEPIAPLMTAAEGARLRAELAAENDAD